MNAREAVNRLLKSSGAFLKRRNNHEVWQLPNGHNFVRACTPSDHRADQNNLSNLKHGLGIVDTAPKDANERRDRKPKRRDDRPVAFKHVGTMNTVLADQLRSIGLVEQGLRDQIAALTADRENLKHTVQQLRQNNAGLKSEIRGCWGCRFRKSRFGRWLLSVRSEPCA